MAKNVDSEKTNKRAQEIWDEYGPLVKRLCYQRLSSAPQEAEALATITQKPPKIKVPKKKILRIAVGSVLFTGAGFALSFLMNLIF